jgi:hypothetical protein
VPANTTPKPRIMPSGYVRVWAPGHPVANKDGYALEHRKVLHDAGVTLLPGHHVHHLNGDKTDNRFENLRQVKADDHARSHAIEAGVVTNQYGVFPVAQTPEEQLARRRELGRLNQQRIRARRRAQRESEAA